MCLNSKACTLNRLNRSSVSFSTLKKLWFCNRDIVYLNVKSIEIRMYRSTCLKPDWETRLLWRIVRYDGYVLDWLSHNIFLLREYFRRYLYESTNTIIIKQNSTQKSFLVSNNQFWLFRIYYYSRAESTLQMNNLHNQEHLNGGNVEEQHEESPLCLQR